jgi:uncharacterized protein (TIGR01777 family)
MKIALTGSSGLIGSALVPFLVAKGHEVVRVPRGKFAVVDGCDGVVHLAGENIAGRWTAAKKLKIHESRQQGTQVLCETLARMAKRPRVLVSASAVGIYGDRGEELITEESAKGRGFLADVCRDWEAATETAAHAGIRVVNMRIGVVLSPRGGALGKTLQPFKLGLGGVIGDGRQYWSWIAIDDMVGAILHSLVDERLRGPANAVAPNPVTNRDYTKTLGRVLRRPTVFPLPGPVARLAFGEMADAILLGGARVRPKRLMETGYEFRFPDLESALRHLTRK